MLHATADESLLLHLNEAIATIREKDQLFEAIAKKLRLIFPFDLLGVNIFDKEIENKRLFFKSYLTTAAPVSPPASTTQFTPIAGSPVAEFVADPRIKHIKLSDYSERFPGFNSFVRLQQQGIRYLTMVPLWLNGHLTGFLMLASIRQPVFTEEDEALLEKIASLLAVAVSNSLEFEAIARREQQRTMQLNITNALLSIKQREPLFRAIAEELEQVVAFDYFGLRVQRAGERGTYEGFAEFARAKQAGGRGPLLTLDPNRHADREEQVQAMYMQMGSLLQMPGLYAEADFKALAARYPVMRYAYEDHQVRAMLVVPIWQRPDRAAVLMLASPDPLGFTTDDLTTVQSLVPQIALALENLFAFEQIEALKAQVEQERTYLIDEINTDRPADGLIGDSAALRQVR